MSDRIVEVEVMMSDMAKSCCRGGNQNPLKPPLEPTPLKTLNLKYGDDDEILKYCTFNETTAKNGHNLTIFAQTSRAMMAEAATKLLLALSTGRVGQFRSQIPYTRMALMKSNDVMPCESIWNPFCCAAEVCVDMMIEMIELMAQGADWMTEMCLSMIDEVGYLADDIIKTEENIVLMGYNIGSMADCIVVFIDQGLEFMTLFCPNKEEYYSLRGRVTLRSSKILKTSEEGCSSDSKKILFKEAILSYSPHTTVTKLSSTLGEKWLERQNYNMQVMSWMKSLKGNPFGEFAQMVDVMMEAMSAFMRTMDDQTDMMNHMMGSLTTFAQEEAKMSTMVIDMAGDVEDLEEEINTQEDLMIELTTCKD
jgi:hypothetical protein